MGRGSFFVRTTLVVVLVVNYCGGQIAVPERIRTSSKSFQDSVDFEAFKPSPPFHWAIPVQQEPKVSKNKLDNVIPVSSNLAKSNEAVHVPFTPTINTKITNEIDFQKSNELLVPVNKPFNRHRVRYQERNRKRNRRKQASRQRAIQQRRFRQRLGCVGTCKNMFSCMFSGQKVDWDKHGTCPGMMDTCCTSWNDKKTTEVYQIGTKSWTI